MDSCLRLSDFLGFAGHHILIFQMRMNFIDRKGRLLWSEGIFKKYFHNYCSFCRIFTITKTWIIFFWDCSQLPTDTVVSINSMLRATIESDCHCLLGDNGAL